MDEVATVITGQPNPVLQLKPFLSQRVGVVVTEGLAERVRDRFEQVVRQKIAWYGSEVIRFCYLANDERAVSDAMRGMLNDGATVILTAGGNMMDPLDATLQALPAVNAHLVRLGAPAHPGSMFWFGETEHGVPLVNLASCSMYSRATVADLVLPWVMAGEQVTNADLAELGHGGLLDRNMSWRFPDYEATSVDEPDESD